MSAINDEKLFVETARRLVRRGENRVALSVLRVVEHDDQAKLMIRRIRENGSSKQRRKKSVAKWKIVLLVIGLMIIAGAVFSVAEQQRLNRITVEQMLEVKPPSYP